MVVVVVGIVYAVNVDEITFTFYQFSFEFLLSSMRQRLAQSKFQSAMVSLLVNMLATSCFDRIMAILMLSHVKCAQIKQ